MLTPEEVAIVKAYLDDGGDAYHFSEPGSLGLHYGSNFDAYECGIVVGRDFIGWDNLDKEDYEELVGTGEECDFELLDRKLIEECGEELLAAIKAESEEE